jgi:hypothetical protein
MQKLESSADSQLPLNAEPEVKLRRSMTLLDADVLDTWDFDVFFYTPEQLRTYVALMFMHLGLTSQDVSPTPALPFSCPALPQKHAIPHSKC